MFLILKALASNNAAFAFYGNYAYNAIKQYNENANIGMMPIPSYFDGDKASLISGERTAIGVFKDSKILKLL